MSLIGKSGLKSLPPPDENHSGSSRDAVTALLEKGSTFEGKLSFEGTAHLNGTFTGEVRSKDTLVIGTSGKVNGDLDVGTLIVDGDITGKIRGRDLIVLHSTARVRGTITTPRLQVDQGAQFDGQLQMATAESGPQKG